MSGYRALDVASYIVNKCIDDGNPISNLKLQKVLYYAQAAFLVNDKRLFDDEISAWRYGPVVENVYYHFRKYLNQPITDKIEENMFEMPDVKTRRILNSVIDAKNEYDAFELVDATHQERPWKIARISREQYIDEADMKEYFKENSTRIYQ